jgi:hypothetical protein
MPPLLPRMLTKPRIVYSCNEVASMIFNMLTKRTHFDYMPNSVLTLL